MSHYDRFLQRFMILLCFTAQHAASLSTVVAPSLSSHNHASFLAIPTAACSQQYASTISSVPKNCQLVRSAQNAQEFFQQFEQHLLLYNNVDSNDSCHALVLNDSFNNWGEYAEDVAQVASNLGFESLILMNSGDSTFAGIMALRIWRQFSCPIPTFQVSALEFDSLLSEAQIVDLEFSPNPEEIFQNSLLYWTTIYIPILVVLFAVQFQSLKRLHGFGAPFVLNTACVVCYAAFTSASLFIVDIILLKLKYSRVSWPNICLFSTLVESLSGIASFSLAVTFHVSTLSFEVPRDRVWQTPVILCAIILLVLHLFGIAWAQFYSAQPGGHTSLSFVVGAVFFVMFRIFISVYFWWARSKTIQALMNSQQYNNNSERKHQIRMTSIWLAGICISNSLGIAVGLVLAFEGFLYHHGWVAFLLSGLLLYTTALFELLSIPQRDRATELTCWLKQKPRPEFIKSMLGLGVGTLSKSKFQGLQDCEIQRPTGTNQ
eukprot:TRINITY_DN4333_c0_g3_i1.p1 TRINITY_DN4333_c0_g3~~TRINITY_DN4333_c0_g3_i1.p1  ORF type:complete len:489 (-),score=84.81 TRINITY_DN4333_c0_g3_i1:9-1475(-)